MTDEQIMRAFRVGFGIEPRQVDVEVVKGLSSGLDVDGAIDILTDYIWDHWLGEPGQPTRGQVHTVVVAIVNADPDEPDEDLVERVKRQLGSS